MKKRILIVSIILCMIAAMTGCGSTETNVATTAAAETVTETGLPTAKDVAGTYSFAETASYAGNTFEVPWEVCLNEDGTYHIISDAVMAVDVTGNYTIDDVDLVTTGTPNEDDATILADFFEDDYSCQWKIDTENKTCTPVKYNLDATAETGDKTEADVTGEGDISATYTDVPYASVSESEICDIYLPESNADKYPVIVVVHGGGFKFGDKTMEIIQPIIKTAVNKGYAVVSINYRGSDEAKYPAALADAKAAVRFIRANADEYGFDTNDITMWGESAGAYLSLMTALTPEVEALNGDVTDNLDQSSAVKNLVDFYGPVEFYTMKSEYEAMGNTTSGGGSFESSFLGVEDIYQNKEACDATYWGTYKDQLPEDFKLNAWIQVGDENDTNVPYTQSVNFASALQEVNGVNVHFEQIEGAGHEDDAFYTAENLDKVFNFLSEN